MFSGLLNWFRPLQPLHTDHDEDPAPNIPILVLKEDGWLDGVDCIKKPSKRTQGLVRDHIDGFVWHWTATRGAGQKLADRIINLPKVGERSASWSLLIPAKGPMVQSVSTLRGSWHAGGSTARQFDAKTATITNHVARDKVRGLVSANALFFGIELENAGEVRRVAKVWDPRGGLWRFVAPACRAWPFGGREPTLEDPDGVGPGFIVPDNEVVGQDGKLYHAFTPHQETQALRVVKAAHYAYPELTRAAFMHNHATIDPSRKTDPGPMWMKHHLMRILDQVF